MEQLSTSCHDVEETAPPPFWRGSRSKGYQLWLWLPWLWFTLMSWLAEHHADVLLMMWCHGCSLECGMQWGCDIPASARPSWVLGMGTGCRHPALPRERCPAGVSPARGGDSSATGAVAAPVCGLLSLLSHPLCFGGRVSANGKLTSKSVHMCDQQCQGKETGIYPPPIALDNASACSLGSS